jgi:hypothetical protein
LGSFRKKCRSLFSSLLLWRLSKAHTWPATVRVADRQSNCCRSEQEMTQVPMAGPADHWPPTVGAFWFHYWLEFCLQFWAASIAAQRAACLGSQLGAKAGRNAARPQLHIVRD